MIDLPSLGASVTIGDPQSGYPPLGVDTEIPLAPALVLFGPNDSGKTNTLSTIATLLSGGEWIPVRDPFRQERWRNRCTVTLRLDPIDPRHRELVLVAARQGDRRDQKSYIDYPVLQLIEEPDAITEGAFRIRLREWGGSQEHNVPEEIGMDGTEDPDPVELLLGSLRTALCGLVDRCAETAVSAEAVADALFGRMTLTLASDYTRVAFDVESPPDELDAPAWERMSGALDHGIYFRGALSEIVMSFGAMISSGMKMELNLPNGSSTQQPAGIEANLPSTRISSMSGSARATSAIWKR